jgi:hypothetical protein
MHRIVKYAITLILLTQILATTFPLVLKTTALTKGVFSGDTFTYGRSDGKPWLFSSPSNAPVRPEWQKYANISTIDFKITQTPSSEPNSVDFNMTIKFENQTTFPIQDGIDLFTGAGQGLIFFIPANLGQNDKIYEGYTNFTWRINETRIDPGWGGREVCFLNHTILQRGAMSNYTTTIINWDRITGALLSVYEEKGQAEKISGVVYTITGGVFYELIDNNVGIPKPQHSGPVDTTLIIIIIVLILIAAFIVVVVRMSTSESKKKFKRLKK